MSFETGHALVIGVGSYANAQHLDVPITADDARSIWNVLTSPATCDYLAEQVNLLTDEQATRQAMLDALDALAQLPKESTVLLFFSGHGVLLPNDVFAFTTHDLRFADDGSIVADSVLTAPDFIKKLRAIRAQKLLCLLNACHSGGVVKASLDIATPPSTTLGASVPAHVSSAILATGSGRVIITACQSNEVAYVGDYEDMTLFPKALTAALSGDGIPNRRGFIGAYDLYDRVYELVTSEEATQKPELTVSKAVGPFPVALYQGTDAKSLGVFEAPASPTHSEAMRRIAPNESLRMMQELLKQQTPGRTQTQNISGNAQVGTAIAGDVSGNVTTIQGGASGTIMSGSFQGPVHVGEKHTTGGVDFGSGNQLGNVTIGDIAGRDMYKGDDIKVGDISGSSGIAIGRGAKSTVRNVNTSGGDYAEGNIDKRRGSFGAGGSYIEGDQTTFSGTITGSNITIKSTLTDVVQTINNAPHGRPDQKAELQQLIVQLNEALQQLPANKASEADAVVRMAEQTVKEAAAAKPNPTMLKISAEGLKAAASNISAIVPTVVDIAGKIALAALKFLPS